jgi:hypothetical protein
LPTARRGAARSKKLRNAREAPACLCGSNHESSVALYVRFLRPSLASSHTPWREKGARVASAWRRGAPREQGEGGSLCFAHPGHCPGHKTHLPYLFGEGKFPRCRILRITRTSQGESQFCFRGCVMVY